MRKTLFWLIGIMILFGLAMLSSAGVVEGQKRFGAPYFYVQHQFLYGVLPGLVLFFICSRINYQLFRKLSFFVLFGSLSLLVMVLVSPFGRVINNTQSWLTVFGYTFQPAEFLKLALVIYLAAWFGGTNTRIKNFVYGTIPFILVIGVVGALLMLQPDMGTLIVVLAVAGGVYLVAGAPLKHIVIISLFGIIAIVGMIFVAPYRLNRIKAFFQPSVDPRGISYQVNQALIGIGSGGLYGVGFGHSRQKFGFLPEPVTDSIFAIISEELGFAGGMATIGLFLTMFLVLVRIAMGTADRFGQFFVMGIAFWIISQAFVNIGAVTGVSPMTGIPLPFISYGGTALASLMAGLGIVANIAKKS